MVRIPAVILGASGFSHHFVLAWPNLLGVRGGLNLRLHTKTAISSFAFTAYKINVEGLRSRLSRKKGHATDERVG